MDDVALIRTDPDLPGMLWVRMACGHWYAFYDAEAGAWLVNNHPDQALQCRPCGQHRQLHPELQAMVAA